MVLELHPILLPILAQAAIFFATAVWAGAVRFRAVGTGQVPVSKISLGEQNWPGRAQAISNLFNNQFETPVYFFAAAILALALQVQDAVMLSAAWLYVASRISHIAVYATSNAIRLRFSMFAIGAVALLVMWIRLAVFAFTGA